jgi:prevent-host-death family protein
MRTELSTTLKRQTAEILSDLNRDKQPIMITHHGLPTAYLIDVESFELQQRRAAILEGIAQGQRDVAEGNVFTHEEVREKLAKWLD